MIAEHLCTNFAPETKPHFLRPILFRRQIRMEEWGPLLNEDLKKLLLGIPKIIVACPLHNTTALPACWYKVFPLKQLSNL